MPINRDMSDLATNGQPPDPEAMSILTALADEWYREYLDDGNDERAFAVEGTRFRASWASGCARATGYRILHNDAKVVLADLLADPATTQEEQEAKDEALEAAELWVERWKPTNPSSLADAWNMGLGSIVHERFENAIKRLYPGAQTEVAVDLRPNVDGSASLDVLITEDIEEERLSSDGLAIAVSKRTTLLELKTKAGFGFKLAATTFKGPPEGPSYNHVVQASLAGYALDVDRVVIGYLSKENISVELAAGLGITHDAARFAAAWSYSREQYRPIAEKEHTRVTRILSMIDDGQLPPRAIDDPEIPSGARITNPDSNKRGMWTVIDGAGRVLQTGTTWHCGYCNHRDRCIADGEGTPVFIAPSAVRS